MKRMLFFLTFSLLSGLVAYAQPYKSMFGSDSTSWIFKWYNLDFDGAEIAYISKDTAIGGLTYKKVSFYNFGAPFAPASSCVLREDTVTGKVWFRSLEHDTADLLAFDFSLMPGDSFDIRNMEDGSGGPPRYSKVDSVQAIAGLKYIYFDLPYNSWDAAAPVATEPYMMIEGIGSNMGPLWKQFIGGYRGQYLLCSSKDGVQTSYSNIRYAGDCAKPVLSVSERHPEHLAIQLAPNPVENTFAIIAEDRELTVRITVHDIVGRLLLSTGKVRIGKDHRIDISRFNPGSYIVSVSDERGLRKTFRVIKQ